jgi:hypothetical protein
MTSPHERKETNCHIDQGQLSTVFPWNKFSLSVFPATGPLSPHEFNAIEARDRTGIGCERIWNQGRFARHVHRDPNRICHGQEAARELVRRRRIAVAVASGIARLVAGVLHALAQLSRRVDFFLTMRGTQRTPHERGYNPSDQRHNLTLSGTINLPWSVQASGILKLISGSPIKVQAGDDLDGDGSLTGDLPDGIPATVGRERVDQSLTAINVFRSLRGLAPIDRSLLALDPYRSLDVRLAKSLPIGREQRLELLIEGFNITNHVNFRPPFGNPPGSGAPMHASAFLIRATAYDARQLQRGIRFAF